MGWDQFFDDGDLYPQRMSVLNGSEVDGAVLKSIATSLSISFTCIVEHLLVGGSSKNPPLTSC